MPALLPSCDARAMRGSAVIVVVGLLLGLPAAAAADAIGGRAPAHPTCPPGSALYMRNHGDGGRCIATECERDADCLDDRRCEEAALCVGASFEANSGARHRLASACEPECAAPAQCQSRRRCVYHAPAAVPETVAEPPRADPTPIPEPATTASAPPRATPPATCSAHAPRGAGAIVAIVMLGLALVARATRRRGRSVEQRRR